MLSMAAADGCARRVHGCCVVNFGVGGPRVVRWGLIGCGGQNRKTIFSTVLGDRYFNMVLSESLPAGN